MIKDFSLHAEDAAVRLGDSLVLASIFAHLGRVRWHINPAYLFSTWYEVNSIFGHLYELEIVPQYTKLPDYAKTIAQYANDSGTPLITLDGYTHDGGYATKQTNTDSVIVGDKYKHFDVTPWTKHLEVKDMSYPYGHEYSLREVFDIMGNAEMHVGLDSGMMWMAAITKTPIFFAHERKTTFQKYLMKQRSNAKQIFPRIN